MRILQILLLFLVVSACSSDQKETGVPTEWPAVEAQARNTTVYMMMWQGDPLINRYMNEYVTPALKTAYGINLQIAPGQGTEIVKVLLAEKEAAQQTSKLDLCWINGETFFQLRQIAALYGPFVDRLPNVQFIDFDNPFIGIDFQQPVDGYECPWGNVQLALIYDSLRTPEPPLTIEALEAYVRAHPGKFTIPYEFTGMTLLKSWMAALGGSRESLNGPFDEEKYARLSGQLWDFINRNKPYFWRQGKTFPESIAAMHQMFANSELDFTMSNNDGEVDNKILQGVFPETARAFVFDSGTIQNAHYLGVPANAANKAGALVVVNFLISPEAQWYKMNPAVWGDGTVLAVERLPTAWQAKFDAVPRRRFSPKRSALRDKAIQEPDPEYMIRLYRDFRSKVIDL